MARMLQCIRDGKVYISFEFILLLNVTELLTHICIWNCTKKCDWRKRGNRTCAAASTGMQRLTCNLNWWMCGKRASCLFCTRFTRL